MTKPDVNLAGDERYADPPSAAPVALSAWRDWAREGALALGGLLAIVLLGFVARLMWEALKLGWRLVP